MMNMVVFVPIGFILGVMFHGSANPPESNPYNKNTLKYLLFEGREFLGNRWKHKIVYPHESYFMLSLHYAWSIIKRKLGLLKV